MDEIFQISDSSKQTIHNLVDSTLLAYNVKRETFLATFNHYGMHKHNA